MGESPEILIYVQKIKKYFKENKEASDYFLKDVDEKLFFKYFTDIAEKNLKEKGEPELTELQFEILRKTVRAICITNEPIYRHLTIWWDLGKYGRMYLN